MDEIKQIVSGQEESHFRVSGIRDVLVIPVLKEEKRKVFTIVSNEASLLTRGRNHRNCPVGGNPRHGLSGKSLKSFCGVAREQI